ncbi:MAG TPA: hypothetical protein P5181_10640 [Dermatophilaceae bacterium]|nr:hypothetical protein [Dermatophilaceae bacterium]
MSTTRHEELRDDFADDDLRDYHAVLPDLASPISTPPPRGSSARCTSP